MNDEQEAPQANTEMREGEVCMFCLKNPCGCAEDNAKALPALAAMASLAQPQGVPLRGEYAPLVERVPDAPGKYLPPLSDEQAAKANQSWEETMQKLREEKDAEAQ